MTRRNPTKTPADITARPAIEATVEPNEYEAFLAWNEAQLGSKANAELDDRIAQAKAGAEASPHRIANALKEEAAELVWEAMEARGLTQAELARRLGKSRAYVSKLLAGGQNLTLESLAELSEALECQWSIALRPTRPMAVKALPSFVRDNIESAKPVTPPLPAGAFRPVRLQLVSDGGYATCDMPRFRVQGA